MIRRVAFFSVLLFSLARLAAQSPVGSGLVPFDFKGNWLGMTLDQFRANNSGETFWIKDDTPSKRGDRKQKAREVTTPFCTDQLRGFEGDLFPQEPGVVLCNPEPGDLYHKYREFAGINADMILYWFYDGRLFKIDISFPAAQFIPAQMAFQQKYGRPSAETSRAFQNKYGATWNGVADEWRRGTERIQMTEGPDNGPGQTPSEGAEILFVDSALGPPRAASAAPDF